MRSSWPASCCCAPGWCLTGPGADTTVIAHIPLSQLRQMPGAADLEDAWIRARLGEDGYLTGKDAEAAACDATAVSVVTGNMAPDVIDQMIELARTAAEAGTPAQPRPDASAGTGGPPDHDHQPLGGDAPGGRVLAPDEDGPTPVRQAAQGTTGGRGNLRPGASPEAWQALRYAMARLAVDLVSGPAGVAAVLRQGLLDKPYNTPSLPLDIGHSKSIPPSIRRAVLLRDRACVWPRCGRPAAQCDVHHLRHQRDGGETSIHNCVLVCQFHHDICIHRRGWQLTLHPDGTTEARSPDGKHILYSHEPPSRRRAA
jgi:hypothetical protein